MMQCHRTNRTGRVFVKRNEEERDLSLEELQDASEAGNKVIENGLLHFGANIKGIMQWKISKRMEHYDMKNFLGLPTFFITFSAADSHWHGGHAFVPPTGLTNHRCQRYN